MIREASFLVGYSQKIYMKIILFVFLVTPFISFSQEKIAIVKDTVLSFPTKTWPHSPVLQRNIMLSNGVLLHIGSGIKLGKGTLPNGDYNYIATPSNTMEAKLKASTKLKSIRIEKIIKKGNERYGIKYIFICEGNYIVQLEDGIASGEIIMDRPN